MTPGHPDKVCDRISDSVLDAIYVVDPMARVACETCATTDLVMVMGEITTTADIDIEKIVREAVREIGYIYPDCGFCADTCTVINKIHKQSPDIALGVDNSLEAKEGDDSAYEKIGAGDQGMMFGFACDETPCYMPFGYVLANELSRKLNEVRKTALCLISVLTARRR